MGLLPKIRIGSFIKKNLKKIKPLKIIGKVAGKLPVVGTVVGAASSAYSLFKKNIKEGPAPDQGGSRTLTFSEAQANPAALGTNPFAGAQAGTFLLLGLVAIGIILIARKR